MLPLPRHPLPPPCPPPLQTVQLSRRDEAATQEKAAELAASAFEEKNRQLQELSAMLNRMEMALAQKVERRSLPLLPPGCCPAAPVRSHRPPHRVF